MKMFWMHWCLLMPWHRLKPVNQSSGGQTLKVLCSCGRKYGMNNNVRAFLPMDDEMEKFFTNPDKL